MFEYNINKIINYAGKVSKSDKNLQIDLEGG